MIYFCRTIYFLLVTFTFVSVSSIYIAYLTTENKPLVIDTAEVDPETLIKVKNKLKFIIHELNTNSSDKTISFTHQQIEQLLSLFSQSIPAVSIRYNYSGLDLLLASSIKLPTNPIGAYLNISTQFNDSKNILNGTTKIGVFTFSNEFIFNSAFYIAPILVDQFLVDSVKNILRGTAYTQDIVSFEISSEINSHIFLAKTKNNLKKIRGIAWSNDQFSNVSHYYNHLLVFSRYTKGLERISLSDYMKPLFKEVKAQSILNNSADENTNALLALALFVGDYNLRNVLGQITNIKLSGTTGLPSVHLAERSDLMLHFIYSCTIEILSDKILSLSIGELKEVIDMDKGGSGFSFADLAADRAGVQFAIMATDKNGGASLLQEIMVMIDSENSFFPDMFALPEGLRLTEFKADYQNTDSSEYKSVVSEIDRRIRDLPLFKGYR